MGETFGVLLQVLAGGFYLLNKIFFWQSERERRDGDDASARVWRINSWWAYLIGLPPWVIIFINEKNWIAASIEAGGGLGMILGLLIAIRAGTEQKPPQWLKHLAFWFIPLGIGYSVYDLGSLTLLTQWLELTLVAGFLIGTYDLAHHRMRGYLWYVLMHISCGWLMYVEGYPWLFVQQLISLVFIADAYRVARSTRVA